MRQDVSAIQALPKPKRQRQLSTQIRIRLRRDETQAFEQFRLKERQGGKVYAETLSSWVRYQLEPILRPPTGREVCAIAHTLYDVVASHAKTLGMQPEEFIEACIFEIIRMVSQKRPQLPAIVKTCRNKAASNRAA